MAQNLSSCMCNCFRVIAVVLIMVSAADFSESCFDVDGTWDFSEANQDGSCWDMDKVSVRETSASPVVSLRQLKRGGFPLTGSQRLLLQALPISAKAIPIRPGLQSMSCFPNRIAALRI